MNVRKSHHDECSQIRRYLIGQLSGPPLGKRSWNDSMMIGQALIQLDQQADNMDRECEIGKYSNIPDENTGCVAPDEPE